LHILTWRGNAPAQYQPGLKRNIRISRCLLLILGSLLVACQAGASAEQIVVVYTSVDQPVAEPIFAEFERATSIKVRPVYDVEATKTTGLVNRLIAEKEAPKADVFWNNEIIQTMVLKDQGVLASYRVPNAEQIPRPYRDPNGYWIGYAARARVLIVNTRLVKDPQKIDSINDLLDASWPGSQIGIANPLFGTTATQAAALYEAWGSENARNYFQRLVARGVRVVDGNSVVRDLVANGQLAFGLTDTDDACSALARGAPVAVILPDQNDLGTLIIPGTVSLISGAPHADQGKTLIDYLLQPATEQALMNAHFSHIPLHTGLKAADNCISMTGIRGMAVDYGNVYRHHQAVQSELREIVLR